MLPGLIAACLYVLTVGSTTAVNAEPQTHSVDLAKSSHTGMAETMAFTGTLRVLTLNVAHGRKDALNQVFLSEVTIRRNLTNIAALLTRSRSDVVALQEADGPSRWSGNFDHVALLAREAGYAWYARADHAKSWLFDYGTALLSHKPFIESTSHAFKRTPPSPTKGLLLGQIAVQPNPEVEPTLLVDVVSVHLDFSRAKVRAQQIEEMAAVLANRTQPTIILGDFNSDWFDETSVVARLAKKCGFHTYRPKAEDLGTYKSGRRRFDWILLSEELEFIDYQVLDDMVSDHYAVVADVGFRQPTVNRDNSKDIGAKCRK